MPRWTSTALACLMGLACSATALAHDPEQMARAMLEEKLKEPWITPNGFLPDFDKALETAAKDKKPIFAYFTVSYMEDPACGKVESGVLSSPEFKKFGESVVLFVHINSGLPEPRADLLREKGGLEVPYFLVMDELGNVTARIESNDVKGFEAAVKSGGEFSKLRAKADKTPDEKVSVLTHEMDIGNLKLQLAKDRVAALGKVTEAQQKQIDASMFRLEVWTAVSDANGSYDKCRAAGKLFAEMWAAGREPTSEELSRPFFILMLDHAEKSKDAKLFKKALEKLRGRYGDKDEEEWRDFFKEQADRLEELEAPAPAKKDEGDAK
jgi:hypothetical protein